MRWACIWHQAIWIAAKTVDVLIGPLSGFVREHVAVLPLHVVAIAVAISVLPLFCIVRESVSVCACWVVTVAISIGIDVLSFICGESIAHEAVNVVAVTIEISIVPLSNFIREGIVGVGHAITVSIQIIEAHFGVGHKGGDDVDFTSKRGGGANHRALRGIGLALAERRPVNHGQFPILSACNVGAVVYFFKMNNRRTVAERKRFDGPRVCIIPVDGPVGSADN